MHCDRITLPGQSTTEISIISAISAIYLQTGEEPHRRRFFKNNKYINSQHTCKYLHCRNEMQYQVLSSQTVSQEGMGEEPQQLCSHW